MYELLVPSIESNISQLIASLLLSIVKYSLLISLIVLHFKIIFWLLHSPVKLINFNGDGLAEVVEAKVKGLKSLTIAKVIIVPIEAGLNVINWEFANIWILNKDKFWPVKVIFAFMLTIDVPGFINEAPEVVFHEGPLRFIKPIKFKLPDNLLISILGKAQIFSFVPTIIVEIADVILWFPIPSNKKVAVPPFIELFAVELSVRLPFISTVPVLIVQAPVPLIVTLLFDVIVVPVVIE